MDEVITTIILIGILIVFIVGLFVVIINGYEDYGELVGQVVDKEYTPRRMIPQVMATGKSCITIPVAYPEKWEICLQKEENRRNKNYMDRCF